MQLVGAWLVWVADQSEAGFGEAQLATYGIRPFGSTGSCENIACTHTVVRGGELPGLADKEESVVSRVCAHAPATAVRIAPEG